VWKEEIYYQVSDEAPIKHVLSGRVLKGVKLELNTEQAQITSLF